MSHQATIKTIIDNLKEAGATSFKPKDLASAVGCTYQTILNYIKANPDSLYKIKHGVYGFNQSSASSSTESVTSVVPQYQINTSNQLPQISKSIIQTNEFDW